METVEFSVQGMHAASQADDLENALTGVSGIAHIETDVPAHSISIQYDPDYTDRDYIARTIKGVGYPARRKPAKRRQGSADDGAEPGAGEPEPETDKSEPETDKSEPETDESVEAAQAEGTPS